MIDEYGNRKYVNKFEVDNFIALSSNLDGDRQLLCMILAETGCRISEALNLRAMDIDVYSKSVRYETLKKRKKGVFRSVPVSSTLIKRIDRTFKISKGERNGGDLLWTIGRMTAYRCIRHVMDLANISGPQACPRGLRHGFAVAALEAGVPITLVQRWLGHADLKTTSIYTHVLGAEERAIASRMWKRRKPYKTQHLEVEPVIMRNMR